MCCWLLNSRPHLDYTVFCFTTPPFSPRSLLYLVTLSFPVSQGCNASSVFIAFALGTFEECSQTFIDFLLVWLFVVFCLQFTWLGTHTSEVMFTSLYHTGRDVNMVITSLVL